jgi:Putative MetA-pathway of phenol degradation
MYAAMIAAIVCAIAAISVASISTPAQDMPLQTVDTDTVAAGHLRGQVGFNFFHNESFPLSGLSGDLTDVGVINIRSGLGNIVEIDIQGIAQEFLSIQQHGISSVTLNLPNANSTNDIGDFSFWTKVRFFGEKGKRPALALRFGYQMPNSDQSRGIGTNSEDIFGELAMQKHFGKLKVFGNVGLAILTSPNALFSQNDELMYGAAFSYPVRPRLRIVGEVNGRYNDRGSSSALIGTESHGQGRVGLQIDAGGLTWSVAGIAGVNKSDARAGFTFGISKDFRLFGGAKN